MSDVHVLLVSTQAAPNLLPALDPDLRPDDRRARNPGSVRVLDPLVNESRCNVR